LIDWGLTALSAQIGYIVPSSFLDRSYSISPDICARGAVARDKYSYRCAASAGADLGPRGRGAVINCKQQSAKVLPVSQTSRYAG